MKRRSTAATKQARPLRGYEPLATAHSPRASDTREPGSRSEAKANKFRDSAPTLRSAEAGDEGLDTDPRTLPEDIFRVVEAVARVVATDLARRSRNAGEPLHPGAFQRGVEARGSSHDTGGGLAVPNIPDSTTGRLAQLAWSAGSRLALRVGEGGGLVHDGDDSETARGLARACAEVSEAVQLARLLAVQIPARTMGALCELAITARRYLQACSIALQARAEARTSAVAESGSRRKRGV